MIFVRRVYRVCNNFEKVKNKKYLFFIFYIYYMHIYILKKRKKKSIFLYDTHFILIKIRFVWGY